MVLWEILSIVLYCIHVIVQLNTIYNRFGKPCVIDMMEVDMFHAVEIRFDEVLPGLLNMMMDKSIMQEEK